ncbi:MAG: repressor, phenylacetic acid degradation operon negative regulatory protein [Candidatus Parcubacteria bacterium]|jgi:DNA-binding transcriptional regulator PaaX
MKKNNPQSAILKVLGRKKAVSLEKLKAESESALTGDSGTQKGQFTGKTKPSYAISRSIKAMIDTGLAELLASGQSDYVRITATGREKLYRDELSSTNMPISHTWDGKWRMIILDLPEDRKSEREALRYLLKKAGFSLLKNSVWVSPFPFEQFFTNIKKDLGLTTEMIIVVTDTIDVETEKVLLAEFGK